jgi:hypothetical protein
MGEVALQDKNYTLEKEKKSAQDTKQEAMEVPVYMESISLTPQQKERLVKEIFLEIDEIKKERDEDKLEAKWKALDAQYEGKLEEDDRRMFNLNQKVTKIKVNKVVNLIMQAYMKSDPKYSITPRPEFFKQGGEEVCEKQSDFIDDRLDNLPFKEAEGLTVHSAVLKGTGVLKVVPELRTEKRKREERYEGKNEVVGADGQGKPVVRNKALEEFLTNWPDAQNKYPGYVKQLSEGKTVEFIASYKETTYNDPYFKNVDLLNFYVRRATEGYEGLKVTRLTAERINYSWWDLKREERKGIFDNINELMFEEGAADANGNKQKKEIPNYQYETYDIFECVYYFKLNEEDEEETKIVCWIAEDRKIVIGARFYSLYTIDCYYVPHYISKKKSGFYQLGMGEDLTDSNLAEDYLLNFILEGAYIANMITPITKDDDVEAQFLEKRWTHGIPIKAKQGDVDFLQKYMRPPDIAGLLQLNQYLKQADDDVTQVSSLMSGRESPLDPTAPASKTIELLRQSGIGIEDYILSIAPAFNEVGYIILGIYYQISKEGRKYKLNPERVVGTDPFATISRNELAARTNIQVMAYAFNFDKLNEKREDMGLFQMLRQELLIARNPEAVYYILKQIIKGWSPKWRNSVNLILPPLEQFKREQTMLVLQGIDMYVKQKVADAQKMGIPTEFKVEELMPLISDLRAQSVTPPPPEVIKAQEKGAQ